MVKAIYVDAPDNGAALVFRDAQGDIVLDPDENLPYDISADGLIMR